MDLVGPRSRSEKSSGLQFLPEESVTSVSSVVPMGAHLHLVRIRGEVDGQRVLSTSKLWLSRFQPSPPKPDRPISQHPATHSIVWRFATDFSVFRNAFHFFLKPCSPLREPILRSVKRSSSCTCSLTELCTPNFTHKRSVEKAHRIWTFGQSMRWSALSDKLCLFWRPVFACKS